MRIKAEDTMALVIDYQTALVKVMNDPDTLKKQSSILIQGLRLMEIPMIITQQYTKGLGASEEFVYEAAGTREYMDKNAFSCMMDKQIAEAVKASGKKNVLLCGVESHICVLQTCVDLKAAGYQPILVADCISSRNPKDKEYAIFRAGQEGAIITSSEAILFELLGKAGSPVFKQISQLIK